MTKKVFDFFFRYLHLFINISSSHNRSSSTRPSRPTQTVAPLDIQRSASVPNRQFIIILTNNPDLLRQTRQFQPQ
ncbi:unnamed protein product, partial [Rotaria sp. Silwood2]